MGTFAHSYVVVGSTPEALVSFYRANGTQAFIYRDERGNCAICDDNDDEPDLELLAELSKKLQAKVFLGQVFDSSVFVATIFHQGVAIDEFIDYPDYLPSLVMGNPILYLDRVVTVEQRATEWATLFDVSHQKDALAGLLHQRTDYSFAEDFHEAVLQALMLPTAMVGQCFLEIEQAYMNEPEARRVLWYANSES